MSHWYIPGFLPVCIFPIVFTGQAPYYLLLLVLCGLIFSTIFKGSHDTAMQEISSLTNQLETLIKYSPGAVAILDHRLHYLQVSDTWYKLHGIRENLIGKSCNEIGILFTNPAHWQQNCQKILQQEHKYLEAKEVIRHPNGSISHLRYQLRPWHHDKKEVGGIIVFTENITEKVSLNAQLDKQQNYLNSIFEHAPFGIALLTKTGSPILLNRQYELIGGMTREELERISAGDPEMVEKYKEDIRLFQNLQESKIPDFVLHKRNGDKHVRIHIAKIATPQDETYTVVTVEDISSEINAHTQKVKAKDEASDLNRVIKETWQLAQIGSWELNLDAETQLWSDSVYTILDLEPGQKLSLDHTLKFFHPEDRKKIRRAIRQAIEHQTPYDLELRIITEQGNERWVRIVGQAVIQQNTIKLRGLIKNIDELKRANMRLESYNADLEGMVKLRTEEMKKAYADLEVFSYSVSHDLRAPLRAIDGFANALIEDYYEVLPETAQHYLNRISRNSLRMGNLIDDLLNYSRMTRSLPNLQKYDLNQSITSLIHDLSPPGHLTLETKDLGIIYGDRLLLGQMFQNLLSNAIKYSATRAHPHVTIQHIAHEDIDEIIITDNGVGFEMEYYDKLFQIFQRLHTESEFEGTGVGLALCKGIVDKHQGTIRAESKLGEGSSFYISLPNEKKTVT